MKDKLKKILNLIDESTKVLITSHRDPDGDSIGSQLALAHLVEGRGKAFRIVNQGELPQKYAFLDTQAQIESLEALGEAAGKELEADLVFVLDCTSQNRMGEVAKIIPPQAVVVNLDHHGDNENFGTLNYLEPQASAVGEMIYSLFRAAGAPLTPQVSTWLFAAILTDTGRFKFSNTSPACLRACAKLIESGADPREITNRIYFNHSLAFLKLLGAVLSGPEITEDQRVCIMTVKRDTLVNLGVDPKEMEGLVNYSLFLQGVEIGLLFTEKDQGNTKVNLRSQNQFDVAQVARAFGGGGHRNAAGCTLSLPLEQAKRTVLENIQTILRHEPVRSLDS
jgi:phosphoesterase RecJ-like protein